MTDPDPDYVAKMAAMSFFDMGLRKGAKFPPDWERLIKKMVGTIIKDLHGDKPLKPLRRKIAAEMLGLLELYSCFSAPKDRKEALRFFAASNVEGHIKELTAAYKADGVSAPIAGHGSVAAPRARAEEEIAETLKISVEGVKQRIKRAKREQRERVHKA